MDRVSAEGASPGPRAGQGALLWERAGLRVRPQGRTRCEDVPPRFFCEQGRGSAPSSLRPPPSPSAGAGPCPGRRSRDTRRAAVRMGGEPCGAPQATSAFAHVRVHCAQSQERGAQEASGRAGALHENKALAMHFPQPSLGAKEGANTGWARRSGERGFSPNPRPENRAALKRAQSNVFFRIVV